MMRIRVWMAFLAVTIAAGTGFTQAPANIEIKVAWEHLTNNPNGVPGFPFMTTRVADVVMLLGIVFMWTTFGTLNFSEAFTAEKFQHVIELIGFGGLGIMTLLLFTGTVGKSAQFPLQAWLLDAMEGPTPASALIHAATMVAAGTVVLAHVFPILATDTPARWLLGIVSAVTMVFAAVLAFGQSDLKRLLAWSTVSQVAIMLGAIATAPAPIYNMYALRTCPGSISEMVLLTSGATGLVTASPKNLMMGISTRYDRTPPPIIRPAIFGPII